MQRSSGSLSRITRRLRVRLGRALSVGIAGRLAMALAIVTILAVTANLLLERGRQVVKSTQLDRARYSPVPEPVTRPPRTRSVDVPAKEPDSRPALEARIQRLVSAVDRFQSSNEVRAASESTESASGMDAAAKELDAAAREFHRLSPRAALAAELDGALLGYRQAGADYVQAADTHRAAAREYLARLDALDGRITASINAGWRIFGRVLARASLLALRSDVEELRRRSAALGVPSHLPSALPEIAANEQSLRQDYDSSEADLKRSEGSEWVRQTREDLARMAELREAVFAAVARVQKDRQTLASARGHLLALLARAGAEAAAQPGTAPGSGVASNAPAAVQAQSSPIVAAAITTTTTTLEAIPDRSRRIAVAGITAVVLALLSALSIWTIRSILIPVGRILDATRRLARGDGAVRVPRGGLKELDSLAAAFNRMAAQLETSRAITLDYRRQLESQVEQRTRQLRHLAERDSLTLLANRRRFLVLLEQSMQRAQETDCGIAVFFIDLDNFKNLNDGMGHPFGDRALISVAQRLEEAAGGFGYAARLGGDEFTVVHEQVHGPEDAQETGRSLVEAFRRPLAVEGREITVSVSIGASLYPDHGNRAEGLLSAADAALFRAKALGRNQLTVFTPELLETASRKFATEQGVRHALEHDEFELVYQPEVSMASLEVELVEALVRWRMPDGRLASPDEFLAVTEESGLIVELGDWVLRHALLAASRWHRGGWPKVRVAVNVSARQLIDHRFVERIEDLLNEYALPATCIELELTESVLQTGSATIKSLRLLRSLGIAIALDDFGTGYSSFASLEQLPLSRIKLDRSLIAGIDSNPRAAAVALALIRLCEELDIHVTAEGVERPSQFARLVDHRELYLQGYLISRPVAESEVVGVNGLMPGVMDDLMLGLHGAPSRAQSSATEAREGLAGDRAGFTARAGRR